eukprot:6172230-Pyramimonas_sp.AAC.1
MKKRPSPFLERASAGAAICKPCRNNIGWSQKPKTVDEVQAECTTSEDAYEQYMVLLFCWEDRYNNPGMCAISLAKDGRGETVKRRSARG